MTSAKKIRAAFTGDYINENGELAFGDIGLDILENSELVDYFFMEAYHDVLLPEQIENIDALFLHGPQLTKETFSKGADQLVFIARCGIGLDSIDVSACTANDVLLANTPLVNLPTASASLMYMLVLSKSLQKLDRLIRNNQWERRTEIKGFDLRGRTLGIVGFGNIARELTRLVAPFDMKILAYDPYLDPEVFNSFKATSVPIETLMQEADFVCVHCALTKETKGLIGQKELALMKSSAYLINLARGPVVDHEALLQVLQDKAIAGAGLDVFYQEPLPDNNPIIELDNVVLSPHWAANTQDAWYEASVTNIHQVINVAQGELPKHMVNPEVLEHDGFQAKFSRLKNR